MRQFFGKVAGDVAPESQPRRQLQAGVGKTQKQQPGIGLGMITSIQFLLNMQGLLVIALSGVCPF